MTSFGKMCLNASFDAILAAVLTILHPQVLLLRERTFEKNKKINNSRTHTLFRVNRVSIDSLSRLCLSSSPEAQGLPIALKLRKKEQLCKKMQVFDIC